MNASSKAAAAGKWTDAECAQFEKGIIIHGWGKWIQVGQLVKTRSITQIKSHAQKFQKCHPDEVKRLQKEHSRFVAKVMTTRQKGGATKDKVVEKKAYEKKEKAAPVRRRGGVKLGDVGYMFRKKFDAGWYTGEVVEIRPLAGEHYFVCTVTFVCSFATSTSTY